MARKTRRPRKRTQSEKFMLVMGVLISISMVLSLVLPYFF